MATKHIKVQVAENTNEIIIDYLSSNGLLTKEEATTIYNSCVESGKCHGTAAFDRNIEMALTTLGLDVEELTRLTSV